MLRKVIVSIVAIGILLGASLAVAVYLVQHRPPPERGAAASRALLVETLSLAPQDVREVFVGYGSARPHLRAMLAAEVSAPVTEIVADRDVGSAVREGEALVLLDDRQYRQELDAALSAVRALEAEVAQLDVQKRNLLALVEIADADLALTRDELRRVEGLYQGEVAPRKELNDARLQQQAAARARQNLANELALLEPRRLALLAQKDAAVARGESARLNIDRCRIAAPFDGVIDQLLVKLGDRVRIGSNVVAVVNVARIEVPLQLPLSVRAGMSVGRSAVMYQETQPRQRWQGTVVRMAPVADERTRTFDVFVEVDNAAQSVPLVPGAFVKAEIDGPMIEDALLVPRHALVEGRVFVVRDRPAADPPQGTNGREDPGDAAFVVSCRQVQVERTLGDLAAVTGEIGPGDQVVTSNLDLLFEGAAVRLRAAEGREAGALAAPAPSAPPGSPAAGEAPPGGRVAEAPGAGGAS